jgi:hypothetical protein
MIDRHQRRKIHRICVTSAEKEKTVDTPQDFHPDDHAPDGAPMPTQAELEAILDASEADVAAGRVMALAPVLARMRAARPYQTLLRQGWRWTKEDLTGSLFIVSPAAW